MSSRSPSDFKKIWNLQPMSWRGDEVKTSMHPEMFRCFYYLLSATNSFTVSLSISREPWVDQFNSIHSCLGLKKLVKLKKKVNIIRIVLELCLLRVIQSDVINRTDRTKCKYSDKWMFLDNFHLLVHIGGYWHPTIWVVHLKVSD